MLRPCCDRYRILTAQSLDQMHSLLDNLPTLPDVLLLDYQNIGGQHPDKVNLFSGILIWAFFWGRRRF